MPNVALLLISVVKCRFITIAKGKSFAAAVNVANVSVIALPARPGMSGFGFTSVAFLRLQC